MSSSNKTDTIESLKESFNSLLNNLEKVVLEEEKNFDIRRTKMWKIKKDLDNFQALKYENQLYLIKLIYKYKQINRIFISNIEIEYEIKDLIEIIGGSYCQDSDNKHKYNHYLFEFTTALSFALGLEEAKNISMVGKSDLIIDEEIAIECKYISSKNKLKARLSEASKQINTRVVDKEAKFGFVAMNVSELINQDKLLSFTDFLVKRFIKNYQLIYKKVDDPLTILKCIASDNNFEQIVSGYLSSEMEAVIYSKIPAPIKMSDNVKGIIFVSQTQIDIHNDESVLPINIRGRTYHLNHDLSREEYHECGLMIHKLAVGI
ncbi:hypothetical protein J8L73_12230 [Pseudoalteromonas sp. MMG006]|uniref:hypothetical protein n=1 Tax=Pseudoalteromonas sp. MMG006 TaxID=2822683 RepID=UPI001B3583CB|nr:hypothetical protein [Pseudoalteromonas sp. MMG006]MBQ4799889.1 hypothetical protein [Pseudoalteromonas sp. MMG006]